MPDMNEKEKINNEINEYIKKDFKNLCNNYLSEDEKKEGANNFIPQFWWGDVSNEGKMKAVILGRNPNLKISEKIPKKYSDKNDNENEITKNILNKNLKFFNREEVVINALLNTNKDETYFAYWWQKAFEGIYINSMEGIAIYNLFGFYSKEFPININYDSSHINIIKDIRQHICNQIKKANCVFLMWRGSWNTWKALLGEEIFKNKNIYVVNARCSYNTKLINAIPMSIDELNDVNKEQREKEIVNIFK